MRSCLVVIVILVLAALACNYAAARWPEIGYTINGGEGPNAWRQGP